MKNPLTPLASARVPHQTSVMYRPIDELKRDPANPRRHTKKQIGKIAGSIKAFGFNVPILIDRGGNVIAGHGRLLAAKELGWTEVPTLCLDHLTQRRRAHSGSQTIGSPKSQPGTTGCWRSS